MYTNFFILFLFFIFFNTNFYQTTNRISCYTALSFVFSSFPRGCIICCRVTPLYYNKSLRFDVDVNNLFIPVTDLWTLKKKTNFHMHYIINVDIILLITSSLHEIEGRQFLFFLFHIIYIIKYTHIHLGISTPVELDNACIMACALCTI